MPRTKAVREFKGGNLLVKTTWKEDEKPVVGNGTVTAPFETDETFKAFVAQLTGTAEPTWDDKANHLSNLSLSYVRGVFLDGLELDVKSYIRPSSAIDNPWVVKGEIRVNMGTGERERMVKGGPNTKMASLPIGACINAVNNGYDAVHMMELPLDDVNSNFVAARKILISKNHAVAVDEWVLKAVEVPAPTAPVRPNGRR